MDSFLGKGGFGSIFKATFQSKLVAIKKIEIIEDDIKQLLNEIFSMILFFFIFLFY